MKKKLFRYFEQLFKQVTSAACSVCGQNRATFMPLSDYYPDHAARYGFVHFGKSEMTSLQTYSCSNCGASDRERLYAFWLDRQIESGIVRKGSRFIHFAPESALSKKIRAMGLFDYKTSDLEMDGVDFRENIMSMSFEDESFEFFICSHILEHVESDDRAIQELYRITQKGGLGILMAPIIVGLEKTVEDTSVISEGGRWMMFGQNDHIRLYAHNDYVNKIRKHGFSVSQLGIEHFGAEVFKMLGLKDTSILYIVEKL